jgi:hypothetical protein
VYKELAGKQKTKKHKNYAAAGPGGSRRRLFAVYMDRIT